MLSNKEKLIGFLRRNVLTVVFGVIGAALLSASAVYAGLKHGNFIVPCLMACALSAVLSIAVSDKLKSETVTLMQSSMVSSAVIAALISAVMPALMSGSSATVYNEPAGFVPSGLSGFDVYFANKKHYIESLSGVKSTYESAEISAVAVPLVLVCVAVLAVSLTVSWACRNNYIARSSSPFPESSASAYVAKAFASEDGKKLTRRFFICAAVAALISAIRDIFPSIPFSAEAKGKSGASAGYAFSPLLAGVGYIAGFRRSVFMLAGAFLSHLVAAPLLFATKAADSAEAAQSLCMQASAGMLLGVGIGTVLDILLSKMEEKERRILNDETAYEVRVPIQTRILTLCVKMSAFVVAYLLLLVAGIPALFAAVVVIAVYFACHALIAARSETGITAGISSAAIGAAVVLALDAIFDLTLTELFLSVFFIAACAALSGELTNSYKTGYLTEASPKHQFVVHFFGATVGAAVSLICFFGLMRSGVNSSSAVSTGLRAYLESGANAGVILLSAAIGAALVLMKIPAASLALGAVLPLSYSACFATGGIVRLIHDIGEKKKNGGKIKTKLPACLDGAAGLIVGESAASVLVAAISWIIGV